MNLLNVVYSKRNNTNIALKQGKREITYKELWDNVVSISQNDYGENDNIGVIIDNSIEFVVTFFSILLKRKVATLIDVTSSVEEIEEVIEKCKIGCICTLKKFESRFININKQHIKFVYIDNLVQADNILNNYEDDFNRIESDDVAVIIPTSGTTAGRKYVQLTHKNILSNVEAVGKLYGLKEWEKGLLSLPMTSMFCLTVDLLTSLLAGMCIVIYDGIFSPKLFLRMLSEEKIDYFITVPAVLRAICTLKKRNYIENIEIKRITIGGEKATIADLNEFNSTFLGTKIIYGYGMTECSPVITTKTLEDYYRKAESVGKPIEDVQIKIIDNEGNERTRNVIGEIIVKGPNIMKGYYGISTSIIENGWLKTGDVGYIDTEGYLFVTGRIKNLIISAGKNIYPEEIESLLLGSGLVADIRVRGQKNDAYGEIVVSDIMLENEKTVEDVKKFCLEHLAYYKVPKKFYVVDKIEKNSMNKIVRKCT